jgi:hypothetical protein
MTTLYEVVLREGVEEARQERAFAVEKSPGDHIHIDGTIGWSCLYGSTPDGRPS